MGCPDHNDCPICRKGICVDQGNPLRAAFVLILFVSFIVIGVLLCLKP
mgnify:FL=1